MKSRLVPFGKVVTPVLAVFLVIYALVLRPWQQRWGATDAEVRAALPGDDLIAAKSQITHASASHAPLEKVWPWLMQIGSDRSGSYSYTRLENMMGCEMPKGRTPRSRREASNRRRNGMVRHAQALQGASIHGGRGEGTSWGFVLKPVDATHSRLMAGARGGTPPTVWARVVGATFWDPAHFVMQHRMSPTIKRLAEQSS